MNLSLKNNRIILASRKNRILSMLIDYFLIVVLGITLYFVLINPVSNKIKFVENNGATFYTSYIGLKKMEDDTKLEIFNEDSYLKMMVKGTLGEGYYKSRNYEEIVPLNETNDIIFNYYYTYKVNNSSIYESSNYDFLTEINKYQIFEIKDGYYNLKEDEALKIGDYLFNKNESFIKKYNETKEIAKNIIIDARRDLKTNNNNYKKLQSDLSESSKIGENIAFIKCVISYATSFIILEIVFYFIFHKRSIGAKAMKLKEISINKNKVYPIIINKISRFITFASSLFIFLGVISRNSFLLILFLPLGNFYFYLFLFIILVLLTLLDFILLIVKKVNVSFDELVSKRVLVDQEFYYEWRSYTL